MHHYKGLFTWEAAVRGGWAPGGALGYVASKVNLQNSVCVPKKRTCTTTSVFAAWEIAQLGCQVVIFNAHKLYFLGVSNVKIFNVTNIKQTIIY